MDMSFSHHKNIFYIKRIKVYAAYTTYIKVTYIRVYIFMSLN